MNELFKKLLRGMTYSYLAYLALCMLVVMPALNFFAPKLAQEHLDRRLERELIYFNPFTLALEVRRAAIVEQDGHRPLAFRRLSLNLSTSSLWDTGIVLDGFVIREMDLHVLRHANGDLHFEDLLTGESDPDEASGELPGLTIKDLIVEAHTLRFTDKTRAGPYTTAQTDMTLHTQNFTTVPDRQGNGLLALTGDGGGSLRWDGELDIAHGSSRGTLLLENIDLTHAWRYNAEALSFVANNARLDMRLPYDVNWNQDLVLSLRDAGIRLHDVDLAPHAKSALPDTAVQLGILDITGIALDYHNSSASIASVAITGFAASGYDESDDISLAQMFIGDTGESDEAANEAPASDDIAEESPWRIGVSQLTINDSRVDWKSEYLEPEVFTLSPIDVSIREFNWPATSPAEAQVDLGMNATASLSLSAKLNPSSGEGNVATDLQGLPLRWANPALHETLRTDIKNGVLSFTGQSQLSDFLPTAAGASLEIVNFATVLHETGQQAFSLARLGVSNASVDMHQKSLAIELLALEKPKGSLHVLEDGRLNVNGVVRSLDSNSETEPSADAPPDEAEPAAQESSPWRILISQMTLREGQLDFADDSLPLPFETLIGNIQADATAIDTAAEEPLSLSFKGSVDGYAPVSIEGSGRPLATSGRDGKLRLNFQGMDIASMSPYSGTYAGYTIDSGTLSLDLNYALDGQKLDGDNRVVISQMELGAPIESELAIDVPLKLGLALLTDSRGVIDLSVPVSGNIDDPSFSLGPIIGLAIRNIIVKAVTAPFTLLASLVGSDENLEEVSYPPGAYTLDASARKRLDTLAAALKERPRLTVKILGAADARADTAALQQQAFEAELLKAGITSADISAQNESFVTAVLARYEAAAATQGWDEDQEAPGVVTAVERLASLVKIDANALQTLAVERATEAKRELVNIGGVEATRIAISYDDAQSLTGVRMELDG